MKFASRLRFCFVRRHAALCGHVTRYRQEGASAEALWGYGRALAEQAGRAGSVGKILQAAQPTAPYATAAAEVGEAPLAQFTAALKTLVAPPVGVDNLLIVRRLVGPIAIMS